MTIGIFGGSFNPVHCGHIALARELVERGVVDQVWMTLSPVNPLKKDSSELLPDDVRMHMLRLACHGVPGLEVCDIELRLPRPSFTINTLEALAAEHPQLSFRLIIGADNMLIFDRWKAHERILSEFNPIVYPRPGYPWPGALNLPVHDISSTAIREMIRNGQEIKGLVPEPVRKYIIETGIYR